MQFNLDCLKYHKVGNPVRLIVSTINSQHFVKMMKGIKLNSYDDNVQFTVETEDEHTNSINFLEQNTEHDP